MAETDAKIEARPSREPALLLGVAALILVWSGVGPADRLTWWLEVAPVLIAVPVLIATRRRLPFSDLTHRLLLIHGAILMLGAHYTYAEVPLGFWLQDAFDLSRNHYDRLGHFAQGFIPAIIAREVLLRWSPVGPGRWLWFLVPCICLAISAFYELIEWWGALAFGAGADHFLGSQGDVWDTQWDMFTALIGSLAALAALGRLHDRAIARRQSGRS